MTTVPAHHRFFAGLVITDVIRRAEKYLNKKFEMPLFSVTAKNNNAYVRPTNRIVIQSTQDLEELEHTIRKFTMYYVLTNTSELNVGSINSRVAKNAINTLKEKLNTITYNDGPETLGSIRKNYFN